MNKIVKIVSCIIVAGIIMSVTIAGKWHVGTSSATLNGEEDVAALGSGTITGTPFRVSGRLEDVGIFYQAIQGTSSPHYRIALYTSPDNSSYTTNAVATLTPSNDETTTNFINAVATQTTSSGELTALPIAPWGRIDVEGAALNAEDTTFNLWIYEK